MLLLETDRTTSVFQVAVAVEAGFRLAASSAWSGLYFERIIR